MVSAVSHTTIDSRDAYAQSEWWKQVLGYVDLPDDPNAPGHEECEITAPDRSRTVLFIQVPEVKTVKNRIHFDLRPTDRTRDEEVERLRGIGAVELADLRHPDGGWVVFADPEGNEFCVLRSQAELDEEAVQQS
ncbi:VOC family protein [Curtobacterium sp. MCPF17_021]|uniref:VOC family protein n=1 Tax=Curtobacterium sp. MCPF17_021 TaxID=2175639 RepID=UPI000DA8A53B|nr:VOC family protein [Curtobacterium sp. MCPF17_021]WIE82990.1 VOC family protein [Curtobacterium sp. MCPF17_021]